jgi:chromate reductase
MHILGISGSLRAASFNSALLRAAGAALPAGHSFQQLDYADVPVYNEDLGTPDSVVRAREAVAAADALLIATPEYNHSVSGALKNVLDWLSRPAFQSVLTGKPTAVMSASPGAIGGARAQQHLKVILLGVGAPVYPAAELVVGGAGAKFADGALVDASTQAFLTKWLAGFVTWVR